VVASSPQLHKGLLHEGQRTGYLSDRCAIGRRVDADRHRLAGEWAGVFDDERVRQRGGAERIGDAPERSLVRHCERDDNRRRMAGSFASGVSRLGDLRTMWEVSPDQRVENLAGGGGGVGLSRRACAITVDACASTLEPRA